MKRRIVLLLIIICLALPVTATAQRLTLPGGATSAHVAAAADYATNGSPELSPTGQIFADPWDFTHASDYVYQWSGDQYPTWSGVPTMANGIFSGVPVAANPKIQLLFEGIAGGLNLVSRNGVTYPINGSFYNRLSFRMRRTPATSDMFEAQWFTGIGRAGGGGKQTYASGFDTYDKRYPNQSPVNSQGTSDWHIYKLDLDRANDWQYGAAWTGLIRGIILTLDKGTALTGGTVNLDWVRLTPRGSATTTLTWSGMGGAVTLTATNGSDTIQIFPDDGTSTSTFADNRSFTWDYGFLTPGTWTITATSGPRSSSVTLYIDPTPIINLTAPSEMGGRDYATTINGKAWDLDSSIDVNRWGHLWDIANPNYGANGLTGSSTNSNPPDPTLYMLDDSRYRPDTVPAIDANTYRHLTFTIEQGHKEYTWLPPSFQGVFLRGVARVYWRRANNNGGPITVSQDIIVYDGGPITFSMDLATFTRFGDDTCPDCQLETIMGHDPWQGPIGVFAIKPLEPSPTVAVDFRLANVRITADEGPNGNGYFPIKWTAPLADYASGAQAASATVALWYYTDADPTHRAIASGVPASNGVYYWNMQGLAPGRYWIYAEITSGGFTASRNSGGPIRIASTVPVDPDTNQDGMGDNWEARYGVTHNPNADDDGDGVSNLTEYLNGTNPEVPNTWYLAEGSTGFFKERIAVANPESTPADISVSYLLPDGSTLVRQYSLLAQARLTINVNDIGGLGNTAVSAVVNTIRGTVVVERTMMWDTNLGILYGGHTGKAVAKPLTAWYLAEGEANFFDTWIAFANSNGTNATASVSYMLEDGSTIPATYIVPANARLTVFANDVAGLRGHAFSTTVTSSIPIIVERAMYFSTGGRFWNGGHEVAAVEAPAADWFVAEGRTGSFFDEWLELANPGTSPATATITYLRPSPQPPITQTYDLRPTSRTTIHVDVIPGLEDTDVSASVHADQPIIVERAMYWPDPFPNWYEAHASAGVTSTGTRWAAAEGEYGGALNFQTYVTLANPGSQPATATLTFLRTAGAAPITLTRTVAEGARVTVAAAEAAPLGLQSGEKFGVVIDSTAPIVVEHVMYWDGGGQFWGGGTNETGIKLK